MDPYDVPTSITLTDCVKLWATPKFEDEFFTEITEQESSLPLEDLCSDGFAPSHSFDPIYSDLKIGRQEGEWFHGSFNVLFKEEANTGCRDNPLNGKVSAWLHFKLRLRDGLLEFDPDQGIRSYERDAY